MHSTAAVQTPYVLEVEGSNPTEYFFFFNFFLFLPFSSPVASPSLGLSKMWREKLSRLDALHRLALKDSNLVSIG